MPPSSEIVELEPEAPPGGAALGLPLFRSEVLAGRGPQWTGAVVLAPRASHRLFTLIAACAVAGVVGLLFLAHFTRTARLGGWLVPSEGVVRVFTPRAGVVASVKVKEGSTVRKDQTLLEVSDELQSTGSGATQAQVMRRLDERRASLRDEQAQQRRLLAQQQATLTRRMAALDAEHAQMNEEVQLLRARADIAARSEALHRKHYAEGFISENRMQLVESERIEQAARVVALQRGVLANRREHLALQGELRDLPLKAMKDIGGLERGISQLGQEHAEAEARRGIVIVAPQDGTVTSIQAVPGVHADMSVPLLSIVPADTQLEAHLYAPSRAVGFVRAGQRVRLRHQAFPYQKYGHQEGEVISVSRSAVSPGDLPRELAGLPGLTAAAAGGAPEPVYRITVRLAQHQQAVASEREPLALRPGMLLEADVALEQRRLFEWVLDPLYSVTGTWAR